MGVIQPVLPLDSVMACYVFRRILLRPQEPESAASCGMVLTTIVPHDIEEPNLEHA